MLRPHPGGWQNLPRDPALPGSLTAGLTCAHGELAHSEPRKPAQPAGWGHLPKPFLGPDSRRVGTMLSIPAPGEDVEG